MGTWVSDLPSTAKMMISPQVHASKVCLRTKDELSGVVPYPIGVCPISVGLIWVCPVRESPEMIMAIIKQDFSRVF